MTAENSALIFEVTEIKFTLDNSCYKLVKEHSKSIKSMASK